MTAGTNVAHGATLRDYLHVPRRRKWFILPSVFLVPIAETQVFGSVYGLLLLAPLFAAVALAIRLDSSGPIFFRQVRMGLGELSQLWNVLVGQMSLVGPRPLILDEHAHVSDWASGGSTSGLG